MKSRTDVDLLVDRFVAKVNHLPRRRIREEDIPLALRRGGAQFGLYYSWMIQPFRYVTWIHNLEERIGRKFPPAFRSLITRYIFPSFDFSNIILLANTGQSLYTELTRAIFRDRVLSDTLTANGFVQFARPISGDYDPVCFDFGRQNSEGECPIVRIDHERILYKSKIIIKENLGYSFAERISDFTSTRRKVRSGLVD